MSHLTDEVVIAVLMGPYLLIGLLTGWILVLRHRIKRLERKADLEGIQWRER
jgi:hypothetical protein